MTTQPDWTEYQLGELFSLSNGINADKSAYGRGTPFVNVLEVITNESLTEADIPGRVTLPRKTLDRYRVTRGDVLFNRTSETQDEVGLASVYLGEHPVVFGGFVFRGRPMTVNLDINYCKYVLRAPLVRKQITARGQGGIRANIGQRDLRSIRMDLPDLPEQRSIANAIDEVSNLIAKLEHLIAKKQAIKQGVMQQLLTGRTRLPGFSGSWMETEVGNLLDFKNGLNKGSEYFGAGTPIVNFMDVMNGPIIQSRDVRGRVTLTRDEIKRFSARKGDLFFTRTSETVDEVGTAAVLVDDITDTCFSGFILRGRPKSADVESRFIARAFQLDAVRAQVMSSATYTTRALTNGRSLGKVVLELPAVDEQRAIAEALDDADADVRGLCARLSKYRAIKIGMMQELLTGRVRLPTEAAS